MVELLNGARLRKPEIDVLDENDMARDLIPPPSPAGRPVAPGTPPPTHQFVELPPEPVAAAPEPPKVEQKLNLPPTQYRNRFGFLAGALGGVVLVSIALAIAVFAYSGNGNEDHGMLANWSKWQPQDESLPTARRRSPRTSAGSTSTRTATSSSRCSRCSPGELPLKIAASAITDLTGDTVVYRLAGLGAGGSIKGEASVDARRRRLPRGAGARALHVPLPAGRRERDGDDPAAAAGRRHRRGQRPGRTRRRRPATRRPRRSSRRSSSRQKARYRAIYFRAGDLKSELQVPLGATVPAGAPNAKTITKAEADDINRRVRSNLFTYEEQAGTGVILRPLQITPLTFGLCADCAHQRVIRNTRGSVFSMCERGLAGEPGYAKYPPMPVVRCAGFEPRAYDARR